MNSVKTFKTSRSVKSVISSRSMKTMFADDDECILDFDDLVTNGCVKFNCPRQIMVTKDFQSDDFLMSMKQAQLTGRPRKFSAAPGLSKIVSTPASDIDAIRNECEIKTVASVLDDDTLIVTALYNTMNKLCEIRLLNQRFVPRVFMQIVGLVAPYFSQLTKITIKKCIIDGYTILELTKFLPLTSITEICLDGTPLFESNYALLLEKPCRVTTLSLCRCKISDEDCKRIVSKLHYLEYAETILAVLNLSSNHITDAGAENIGAALRTNRHLRYLNLADNCIGDDGAHHILQTLRDFSMTCDEIVGKRRRYFDYLKTKQEINLKFKKPVEDISISSQKGKSPKISKAKKSKTEMVTQDLAEQFIDPFSPNCTKFVNGYSHCIGNMILCYLNLSYNNLSYISLQKLRSVLLYQNTNKSLGHSGLIKVVIDGNPMPCDCDEFHEITDLLQKNVILLSPRFIMDRRKSRISCTPPARRMSMVSDNMLGNRK